MNHTCSRSEEIGVSPPPSAITVPVQLSATVLIVEDDDDLADLLDHRLRHEHLSTIIARDGEEACRVLNEAPAIDLVLLDLLLPLKDGWDVCRFIRQHPDPRIASLPVIMLSALSSGDNRIRGMECGADVYLAKPYSLKEVMLTSRNLLAKRQQEIGLRSEIETLRHQERKGEEIQRMLFHELRSQFTVIGGLCHRLLKCSKGMPLPETATSKNYLEVISHSVRQLSEMADEMLLLSKMQTTDISLPLTDCRLDEIVAEVVAVCSAQADLKGIGISVTPISSRPVRLHRLGVKIIISSLLENAVKYSPPASRVALEITLSDTVLRLEVRDQGPGIPLHEQERIFEPYYRGEAARASHQGSGLGLYSVRRLAESLGGAVTLVSSPGAGSRFCVTLSRGDLWTPAFAGVTTFGKPSSMAENCLEPRLTKN